MKHPINLKSSSFPLSSLRLFQSDASLFSLTDFDSLLPGVIIGNGSYLFLLIRYLLLISPFSALIPSSRGYRSFPSLPLSPLSFLALQKFIFPSSHLKQDRFDLTLSHYKQVRSNLSFPFPFPFRFSFPPPVLTPLRFLHPQVCTSLSGLPPVLSVLECATMQESLPRCEEMMKVSSSPFAR